MAPHHTPLELTAGAARSRPSRPRRFDGQAGQTLPLFVVFLVGLLGMCALAIDVGSWAQGRRAAQNSADASALAGAAFLGVDWSTAQATHHRSSRRTWRAVIPRLTRRARRTSPTTRFR